MDNGKERKIIFEAEMLDDKTVKVSLKSNFVPMLTFAAKLLDLEIENMIIQQNMKREGKIQPIDLSQLNKIKLDGFKI